eukprot:CAMPEP_0203754400 /NCGR_PEP_ID=MMETSP0098-20131031/7992_1 /ASSEMBLY_ACC=CAM_ASM_000208 /TAXON_ID=96639 /ORGANISM=" , Strain NY0313808BC1" /LENGTH=724 /DNA_ID=CAMNT_0050645377 /DNA_START=110 /DNA_END=2284 /DNA_ORIENTATION=+
MSINVEQIKTLLRPWATAQPKLKKKYISAGRFGEFCTSLSPELKETLRSIGGLKSAQLADVIEFNKADQAFQVRETSTKICKNNVARIKSQLVKWADTETSLKKNEWINTGKFGNFVQSLSPELKKELKNIGGFKSAQLADVINFNRAHNSFQVTTPPTLSPSAKKEIHPDDDIRVYVIKDLNDANLKKGSELWSGGYANPVGVQVGDKSITIGNKNCVFVFPNADDTVFFLKPLLESECTHKVFYDLYSISKSKLRFVELRAVFDLQILAELKGCKFNEGIAKVLQTFGVTSYRQATTASSKIVIFLVRALEGVGTSLLNANQLELSQICLERLALARRDESVDGWRKVIVCKRPGSQVYDVCSFETAEVARLLGNPSIQKHENVDALLEFVPPRFVPFLKAVSLQLVDIQLDEGRPARCIVKGRDYEHKIIGIEAPDEEHVTKSDLGSIVDAIGEHRFGLDNRVGLDKQLHRVSAIRNEMNEVIGLTVRVGRAINGIALALADVLLNNQEKSVLLVGPPGTGKTTIIRDIARLLSEDGKNVFIVDTSNEIAGSGNVPHPCIGLSRRMMVKSLDDQARVMIECLQNHTPHTMIIDEIGRKAEVSAAQTVKERGVRVVASAHGSFRSLANNIQLNGLLGGKEKVTLGDEEARNSNGGNKTRVQRASKPVFDIIIELDRHNNMQIIPDCAAAFDRILENKPMHVQARRVAIKGDNSTEIFFKDNF